MPRRPLAWPPRIVCDDACHKRRGSLGGTDYAVVVGTPVYAMFSGMARYRVAGTGGWTPMIRLVDDRVEIIGRVAQAGSTIATLTAELMPLLLLRFLANTGSSGAGVAPIVVDPATNTIYTSTGSTVNLAHSWTRA